MVTTQPSPSSISTSYLKLSKTKQSISVLYYGPQEATVWLLLASLIPSYHVQCFCHTGFLSVPQNDSLSPQDLCTCCPILLDTLLPHFPITALFSSLTPLFKGCLHTAPLSLVLLPEICLFIPFLKCKLHNSRDQSHSRLYVSYLQ